MMDIEITLSNGTKHKYDGQAGWWRANILNSGLKIINVIVEGVPFQPNADGYFMLYKATSFSASGQTFTSGGIGYVKHNTKRARIVWYHHDGSKMAEVMKPIPEFIKEIMVERKICL